MTSFSEKAQASAENSSLTLQHRWIIRIVLISVTSIFTIIGIIILAVGGSSNYLNFIPNASGLFFGGSVLLAISIIIGISWASAACCCGHLWCCSKY